MSTPIALKPLITARGFSTEKKLLQEAETKLVLKPTDPPSRLLVAMDGGISQNNGGAFSVLSFLTEPKRTLIVYGTADDTPTNKEAAKILQQSIRQSWCNVTVPIKTDKEATDDTDVVAAEPAERSDADAATEATEDAPAGDSHSPRTTTTMADRRARLLVLRGVL